MNLIKKFLNSITMYRLVLWSLVLLAGLGLIFSLLDLISYQFFDLTLTLVNLVIITFATNQIVGRLLKVPLNRESWIITALILFLILPPATNVTEHLIVAAVGGLSMLSKYLLALRHKHFFFFCS